MTSDASQNKVAHAIARVRAIDWNQSDRSEREGSQIALMREFLRRMALWADALACTSQWPFFDVADKLAGRHPAAQTALADVQISFDDLPFHPRKILTGFVKWAAIEDLAEVSAYGLPAPFEPAIVMYERGGVFHVENRMFQFNLASFPLGTPPSYLGKPAIAALDADALTAEDEAWRQETAGRATNR